MNTRDPTRGASPLMFAAEWGHTDVVNLLLERGADVNAKDVDGWTPLMIAVGHGRGEVVSLLREHGAR